MQMRTLVTLAALALLTSSARADPAALDELIAHKMADAGLVGLGAAIIVHKQVVWMKGYGFADKARGTPFTPDTVMNIASISKTITGAAVMRAVQDGKLSLDEDINRYLPFKVVNPYFPAARITLRQLATHTSSITDRAAIYDSTYYYGGDAPEALGDFLKGYFTPSGRTYAKDNFLNVKPGTHREYSNIAAGLAGYIVERAVGQKLNVYTRRQFFAPLAMTNTGWFFSEVPLAKHAKLYASQVGLAIPIPLYGGTTYPDGGVRTSVADLSKFFLALLSDGAYGGARILDKASVDEMLRFQYTATSKPDNVDPVKDKNSGIFWSTKFNVTRIGHGGSDPGVTTDMLADLSKDIGVILFTNTSTCAPRAYAEIFEALWTHAVSLK